MYRDDILYYFDYYIILGHVECNINTFLHMYMEGSYYEGIMPVVCGLGGCESLSGAGVMDHTTQHSTTVCVQSSQ